MIHDHFSKRNFPYLIKSEVECPAKLREWLALCKKDGVTPRHMHTDNAKIFAEEGKLTETCRSVLREHGVHMTTICPNVPRQNGVCEHQWSIVGADCPLPHWRGTTRPVSPTLQVRTHMRRYS